MKTTMELHSALEHAIIQGFLKCRNRKEERLFVKSLTKSERKFLKGQLEYKEMMNSLRMLVEESDEV